MATWTNLIRVNNQQKQPSQHRSHRHSHPIANRLTLWNRFPRNPSTLVLTLSSWPSWWSLECCLATNLAGSPSPFNRGNKYVVIFYIYDAYFVKSVPVNSYVKEELLQHYHLVYAISQHGASDHKFTRWTTRRLMTSKHSFAKRTHAYSTPHLTSTAPIWQNGRFALGKTTSSTASLGCQRPSQSQIGIVSPTKQTSLSTCYSHAVKILLYRRSRHSKGPTCLMQHQWLN